MIKDVWVVLKFGKFLYLWFFVFILYYVMWDCVFFGIDLELGILVLDVVVLRVG